MDDFILKAGQALSWLKGLDRENLIILVGGFLAFLLLLNLLWRKGRGGRREERAQEPRYYPVPSQPLVRPEQPKRSAADEDISQYTDVVYKRLSLMSQTEVNFWSLLYQAAPGYHIFPQMATGALLTVDSQDRDHFKNVLRAFSDTRIDFVICDPKLEVVALVELDDRSHDDKKEKDKRRDFITSQAGYKTVRFDCRDWPNVEQIKKKIFG